MKRTVMTCDRPGCGIEFAAPSSPATVWIRFPPVGNLGDTVWDLCPRCAEELRDARVNADLAFGDRLRPAPDAKERR